MKEGMWTSIQVIALIEEFWKLEANYLASPMASNQQTSFSEMVRLRCNEEMEYEWFWKDLDTTNEAWVTQPWEPTGWSLGRKEVIDETSFNDLNELLGLEAISKMGMDSFDDQEFVD